MQGREEKSKEKQNNKKQKHYTDDNKIFTQCYYSSLILLDTYVTQHNVTIILFYVTKVMVQCYITLVKHILIIS